MRRQVLVAGMAAVVLALPQTGSVTASPSPTRELAAAGDTHVIKYRVKEIELHPFGKPSDHNTVSTDENRRNGKVIGYTVYSTTLDENTGQDRARVGIALRGGLFVAHLRARLDLSDDDTLIFKGRIRGGLGRFIGAEGTVRYTINTAVPGRMAAVKVRWRRGTNPEQSAGTISHTVRMRWHGIRFTTLGKFAQFEMQSVRLTRHRHVRGYAATSSNGGEVEVFREAFALKGGVIMAKMKEQPAPKGFQAMGGPIKGGLGKYQGAAGRVKLLITDTNPGPDSRLRIHWR